MAVEDEKINAEPSMEQITKLLQLYMVGVEILESSADKRFAFFNNKIQSLMLRRHVVKKLHQNTRKTDKEISYTNVKKEELKEKKNHYDLHCYYNQGRVDFNVVKEILSNAAKKDKVSVNKVSHDIKRQEDRLEKRIKERKLRSENGSVHKLKFNQGSEDKNNDSHLRDSRFEYFEGDENTMMKLNRQGSIQKLVDRKYGKIGKGIDRRNLRDS